MANGHESIGKRLRGAVRPALGLYDKIIHRYESPLIESLRFTFPYGLRRPCSCALRPLDTISCLSSRIWEESLTGSEDYAKRTTGEDFVGLVPKSRGV